MLVTLRDQRFKRGKSLIAMELSICGVLKYVVFFAVEKQLNSARFIKIISRYLFLGSYKLQNGKKEVAE